jgi:acyl-coenzyme A thioesterase PaaI-like protein
MERQGPFWDAIEGRVDLPPATSTLGFELIAVDPDAGTIEVGFLASDSFLNPVGVIQGGFLAAMLDETLGPALVATLGPTSSPPRPIFASSFCVRPSRDAL